MTLRNGKELEEVVKTREDPTKLDDSVLHDVLIEEATTEAPTKDVSKAKTKGMKKSYIVPSKHSPPLPYPQRLK